LVVSSASAALHVPYLYLVGTGSVDHLIIVIGFGARGFTCSPQEAVNLALRAVDKYGVVVEGQQVTFSADVAGSITPTASATNQYGIAQATLTCGAEGTINFSAAVGGMTLKSSATTVPLPAITQVVNAASFEQGKPVAPGSYITIFGTELQGPQSPRVATTEPLPLVIQGTRVSFDQLSIPGPGENAQNLISAPGHLSFSSPRQINLQVPWEFQLRSSAQVKVMAGDNFSKVVTVPLAVFAPAFFEISGISPIVVAQDVNFNTISANNPAHAGQTVILYANGLGPVNNRPASGSPALASPLSATTTPATVTVGGQNATVLFSGLAPGYPALYQINATLPQGLAAGVQPITVTIGGITSKTSHIPVQ
jgi:uncharacterized protein (TIGR03437 family)